MPKATVTLASGAVVHIEGTAAEVKELLALYGETSVKKQSAAKTAGPPRTSNRTQQTAEAETLQISDVVNHIKNCDEADDIEKRILDTTSQVNRILLPLFVVQKHMGGSHGLTTGEISAITRDLGIPIHVANVSNAIKGTASRYVIGDKVRKQGQPVKYKLSRRGIKYLENVIKGKSDGE